jgi:hypothetical protein
MNSFNPRNQEINSDAGADEGDDHDDTNMRVYNSEYVNLNPSGDLGLRPDASAWPAERMSASVRFLLSPYVLLTHSLMQLSSS